MPLFRPSDKKQRTLWSEFPDYRPINDISQKPLYEETIVSEEHRILGEIIQQNWELLHPLSRDYMLSAADEWQKQFENNKKNRLALEEKQKGIEEVKADYELKIQRLSLEKDAQIEKLKKDLTENFKEISEKKDQEIQQHKLLAESVSSSFDEPKQAETLPSELSDKDRKIVKLEALVRDLKLRLSKQEEATIEITSEISRNFQQEMEEMDTTLHSKKEQNEKLREVLRRAKGQLIALQKKNKELTSKNKQLKIQIDTLERMIAEKDYKIEQIAMMLRNLK